MSNRPAIISVEGNIGAGKTTLLEKIEAKLKESGKTHIVVLREPVDIWSQIRDPHTNETILQKFYQDVPKYAFPFQVMAFNTRLMELKRIIRENPECNVILCERSLSADGNIFAKMLHDDGAIDPICYNIYKQMYESAICEFPLDKIIYLNPGPEICRERITMRGREGEESISIDYLKRCHDYHEKWMENSNIPVVPLDTNNLEELDDYIETLMNIER